MDKYWYKQLEEVKLYLNGKSYEFIEKKIVMYDLSYREYP